MYPFTKRKHCICFWSRKP